MKIEKQKIFNKILEDLKQFKNKSRRNVGFLFYKL